MLDISKKEHHLILVVLLSASVFLGASHFINKNPDATLKRVEINEPCISININTATIAELERLPDIGPVLARGIVNYRDSSGGYKSKEELKNVKGIGDKKFEKIKDLVIISE